jgi:hypothetical protein
MIQALLKLLFRGLDALFNPLFKKRKEAKLHEIGTHKELQEKYNLYAENRPNIKLDSNNVPENLRDLIPYAEKWGISDDIIRSDFQKKASKEEKLEFKKKISGRVDQINEWLDTSFPTGKEMSDEGAAFMYMLSSAEEL